MAGKTRTENTFVELDLQERWEQRYPELRCVMAEDPEKYRHPQAQQNISRLQKLGYRPISLTDDERFELMDCNDHILLGCPVERYQRNLEDLRATTYRPDETTETIG